MRIFSAIAGPILLTTMLSACAGSAAPVGSSTESAAPLETPDGAAQSAEACHSFNSRIWAQTVFDTDPEGNAALDPDHDDLACEDLPAGIAPALWTDEVPANAVPVELIDVTDGDTIVVNVDGRRERVRLVGVDAHETNGPYQEVECYGPQASDFLTRLLGIDAQLWLEQDQEDRDRYGRLLRWVWADFGTGEVYLLNEALVRIGYAERFRNTPNRRYVDEVTAAEVFAQRHQLGLWGFCNTGS
jgi:micrococcal nuclease